MLMVGEELIDASTLPQSVVAALKEKADAELTAAATEKYQNLRPEVAKKLYVAFKDDAEMSEALSGFNSKMGSYLEEHGNSDPAVETLSAQEKLDKAVAEEKAKSGVTYEKAYHKVAMSAEGQQLIKEIYKEKE